MADLTIWFPFYIGDFLANTARFNTEEIGALLLLQADYFRNGPPPNDERILRQTTRLRPSAWGNAWLVLKECFAPADDGRLHNPAWDREVAEIHEKRLASSTRAENAAKARWTKHALSNASSNSQAELDTCQSKLHSQSETEFAKTKRTLPLAAVGSPNFVALYLKDKTEYFIDEIQIAEWELLYRAIDVRQELRKYKGWSDAKPERRKTRQGIRASVNSWLSKAQDDHSSKGVNGVSDRTKERSDSNAQNAKRALDALD